MERAKRYIIEPGKPSKELVECRDCVHRDPANKKCDSGGNERQGCFFQVDDNYFCAYGERRNDGSK